MKENDYDFKDKLEFKEKKNEWIKLFSIKLFNKIINFRF